MGKGAKQQKAVTKIKNKQNKKVIQKIKTLKKKGKLKRHVFEEYRDIDARKHAAARQKIADVEEDWKYDRAFKEANDDDDDILPLDMLDADIDWENSAFASKMKRIKIEMEEDGNDETNNDDLELKPRHFEGELDSDQIELLPIKIDGKLVKRSRKISEELNDDDSESGDKKVGEEWKEDDLSGLSAVELMRKRNEMIETAKQEISDIALNLLAQPQQQIDRLRVLIGLCKGERIHSLIRETVQKLAIASTVEVFVDIIPGYAIRSLTEEEKSQKMKKETKKLHDYENTLLNYYNKYLQVIEKNVTKVLPKKGSVLNEATFTYKLALVSLRSLCKLLVDVPHFNFSTNIISLLVRLTTSKHETVIDECCDALSKLFKSDLSLKYCAFGARAISAIVNEKKSTTDHVSSKLLLTLLCMNIKEIDMKKDDHGKEKEKLLGKRFKLAKERQSKTKNKYSKQLKKLESDLKEIEAAESLTTKVKYATEAMKYIFLTYFRVIKHMPNSNLLEPVLEGLSKFAHLLNVEFFDDIVSALQTLVDQQHMKVLDSLHCIHAVFVILSGEGSAINVDPYRFYKSIYRIMNDIPFEKRPDVRDREMILLLKSLHLMINHRRKQVILCRVAAFVKRLLHISFLLPTNYTIAILCAIRTFFISHPRLNSMLECDDDDRSVVNKSSALDVFIPEVNDPDCCNALSTSIILETDLLSKHPNAIISQLAKNIRAACPSSGANRVSADLSNCKPNEIIEKCPNGMVSNSHPYFSGRISTFLKKNNSQLTSKNLQSVICKWLISIS